MLLSLLVPKARAGGLASRLARTAPALWQEAQWSQLAQHQKRALSTETDLRSVVAEKIPEQQERLKEIKKTHGNKVIGDVTVNMCIGGMRGINVKYRGSPAHLSSLAACSNAGLHPRGRTNASSR